MGERITDFISFIYWFFCDEVLISIFKTLTLGNPCKSKKCLVRASCTVVCDKRLHYLRFCDREGHITFQRICAISIIFGVIMLTFGLITWYYKM